LSKWRERPRFFNPRRNVRWQCNRAELIRALNEPAELEILIAHHAGIRCAAGLVFIGKILDDVLLEFRRFVNEVIRNTKFVADGARVGDGLRAAAFCPPRGSRNPAARVQRDADDLVTLLDQKRRRREESTPPLMPQTTR